MNIEEFRRATADAVAGLPLTDVRAECGCGTESGGGEPTALEMVEGGLYRNPMGAEIRVLHALDRNSRRDDPMFRRGIVPATLGAIWVAEDVSEPVYGMGRLLVTAEGLASCGYFRVAGEPGE